MKMNNLETYNEFINEKYEENSEVRRMFDLIKRTFDYNKLTSNIRHKEWREKIKYKRHAIGSFNYDGKLRVDKNQLNKLKYYPLVTFIHAGFISQFENERLEISPTLSKEIWDYFYRKEKNRVSEERKLREQRNKQDKEEAARRAEIIRLARVEARKNKLRGFIEDDNEQFEED